MAEEIADLRKIRAHALITTNYDLFLENLFEDYAPIIGQAVIRYDLNSFGEIFKIHGSVENISTMILTEEDYDHFATKQKYITAKLLTYLAEHPVFVFGYGFNDPNVTSIIQDLGEIIADDDGLIHNDDDGLIHNIYYVAWDPKAQTKKTVPEEFLIQSAHR